MEFLASLAIKALVGTSICGTVSVGAVYKYDRTLLGFAPLSINTDETKGNEDPKQRVGEIQTGTIDAPANSEAPVAKSNNPTEVIKGEAVAVKGTTNNNLSGVEDASDIEKPDNNSQTPGEKVQTSPTPVIVQKEPESAQLQESAEQEGSKPGTEGSGVQTISDQGVDATGNTATKTEVIKVVTVSEELNAKGTNQESNPKVDVTGTQEPNTPLQSALS